jgi:hypothetical protein
MSATSPLAAPPDALDLVPATPAPDEANEITPGPIPGGTTAEAPALQQSASVAPPEPQQRTSDHQRAIERIRQSTLPPALRERLAAAVEAGKSSQLAVATCLEAIEQALPDFLLGRRENVAQPAHPIGNAFFQGGDGDLSDAEAEALAQQQLARSGLLRGQRVKAAD